MSCDFPPDSENFFETTPDDEPDASKQTAPSDPEKLHKLNKLLDKLTLEMLVLMEQHIEQKRRIETLMTEGEANLAKSRYIMGHKNVSALQLPTELSNDIDPAVTVEEMGDDERFFGQPTLTMNVEDFIKAGSENGGDSRNVQDPKNWFGVLVPRNLTSAQANFKDAISVVVDCANTQTRLNRICLKIQQVRDLRDKVEKN